MHSLAGKRVTVIGASRGVGRTIAEVAHDQGAQVLAVARQERMLRQLAEQVSGISILPLDATDEDAPARAFGVHKPDVLVLCAGALPPAAPFYEQNWHEFAINWETDVRIAFHFCKAALCWPLAPGTSVIVISSGAALAGSPNSGGYAGAKRTQLFIANYAQKESDRLGLGLHFSALAPRMMPDTDLGRHAVAGYARYLGITPADFIGGMASAPGPSHVANGVIELVTQPDRAKGNAFIVTGKGLEATS
ncbi:SDR family NAD(P)-dependent oxidoreductase [Bradyrhizobium neotropicale]|uniref:Short-chain dehydrogenase n=1 Tax=Bradyrhizobium neotropicale TaxID=1497615 RepID=A0A176YQH7_9BRAD|nr:SDR family oxidoreductase [Bradyrhizobium neotropicale]OAF09162.1 short-chain dehydrogenase [Bradyrhizobium neotropicale]